MEHERTLTPIPGKTAITLCEEIRKENRGK